MLSHRLNLQKTLAPFSRLAKTLAMFNPTFRVFCACLVLASSQIACSLFDTDFEGQVELRFSIDDEDNIYENVDPDVFDPTDHPDFAENRERIKGGTVESMIIEIDDVGSDADGIRNQANIIYGQIYLRQAGDANNGPPLVPDVGEWDGLKVIEGARYFIDIPGDKEAILTGLIFNERAEALSAYIEGGADTGPVHVDLKVTLNMRFTAGL